MHSKTLHMVAFILLVIGGLNWLLHALGFNVVNLILGAMPMVENIIYILIGLAAIYEIVTHKANCTQCGASSGGAGAGMTPGGDITHG